MAKRKAAKQTKKASTKKAPAKKAPAKKAPAKKARAKKAPAKKAPARPAKKAVSKKFDPRKRSRGTTTKVKKTKKVIKNRLTKAAMEPYKKLLLDRKADLVRQVLVQNDDMDELKDDQPADPLDMAINTSSLEMMTALGNNERMELSEIDEALRKVEAGTYGMCEICTDEPLKLCNTCPNIPKARLEAIPTARYCIQVKEQQERSGAYADRPRRRALLSDDLPVSAEDE